MKMAIRKLPLPAVALALALAVALGAALHTGVIPIPVPAHTAEAQSESRYHQFDFDRLYDATVPHAGYQMGDEGRLLPCEIDLSVTGMEVKDVYCHVRTEQAKVTLKNDGDESQHYRAYVSTGAARTGDEDQFHPRVRGIYREDLPMGRQGVSEYRGQLPASGQRVIDLNGDMATPDCFWYSPGSNIGQTRASICSIVYMFIYKSNTTPVAQLATSSGLPDLDENNHIMVQIYFQQELDLETSAIFLGAVRYDGDRSRTNVGTCRLNVACSRDGMDFELQRGSSAAPTAPSRVNLRGFYNPAIGWQRDPGVDRAVDLTGRYLPTYTVPEPPNMNTPDLRLQTFPSDNPRGAKFELDLRDVNNIGYFEPGGKTVMRIDFKAGSNLESGARFYEVEVPNRPRDVRSYPYYHHWRGWKAEGPMRGTLSIAYHHPDGSVHEMQPFTLYAKGPPAAVNVPGAKVIVSPSGRQTVHANYEVIDGMGHRLLNGDILQDSEGRKLDQAWQSVRWEAADAATRAVIGRSGSGNGGSVSIPVLAGAPAGEYTVNLIAEANSDATGGFTFTVPEPPAPAPAPPGAPANYAIAGPDQAMPGSYATYTVTATDANGGVPNLAGDHGMATVAVSGAAAADVRLLYVSDGRISLDARGVGYFRLRVPTDAMAGSVSIAAGNVAGDAGGSKTVAIGRPAQ